MKTGTAVSELAALGDRVLAAPSTWRVEHGPAAGDFDGLLAQAVQLGPEHLLVALYAGEDSVASVAFWSRGGFFEPVEFRLTGTPAAQVFDLGVCVHVDEVRKSFPGDPLLAELDAVGYFALPIRDFRGVSVGFVAVMGRDPVSLERAEIELLAALGSAALRLHSPAVEAA